MWVMIRVDNYRFEIIVKYSNHGYLEHLWATINRPSSIKLSATWTYWRLDRILEYHTISQESSSCLAWVWVIRAVTIVTLASKSTIVEGLLFATITIKVCSSIHHILVIMFIQSLIYHSMLLFSERLRSLGCMCPNSVNS